MKIEHLPYHWIVAAIVAAVAAFTLSEARGQQRQHTDAGAVFEGRPAMGGAQAGVGAMAGPPQGGIGAQGNDDARIGITQRPRSVTTPRGEAMGANAATGGTATANTAGTDVPTRGEMDGVPTPRKDNINVTPRKDRGIAKDERSPRKKAQKAAKRTTRQARHGVPEVSSQQSGK